MAAENFFTYDTFGTVTGCSFAIVMATNTIRAVFRLKTPLVPFVLSLLIGFIVAAGVGGHLQTPLDWLLAFLNSCLLFCTATGAQEVIVTGSHGTGSGMATPQSAQPLRFWSSWVRPR